MLFALVYQTASSYSTEIDGKFPQNLGNTKPYELSFWQERYVSKGIEPILKDPESLKLSNLKAAEHESGIIIVCGEMNSKNSYGGYGGKQTFIGKIENKKFSLFQIGDDSLSEIMVSSNCSLAKIPIDE